MDVGTIQRVNSTARQGRLLSKRIGVFFRGKELGDEGDDDTDAETGVPMGVPTGVRREPTLTRGMMCQIQR